MRASSCNAVILQYHRRRASCRGSEEREVDDATTTTIHHLICVFKDSGLLILGVRRLPRIQSDQRYESSLCNLHSSSPHSSQEATSQQLPKNQ